MGHIQPGTQGDHAPEALRALVETYAKLDLERVQVVSETPVGAQGALRYDLVVQRDGVTSIHTHRLPLVDSSGAAGSPRKGTPVFYHFNYFEREVIHESSAGGNSTEFTTNKLDQPLLTSFPGVMQWFLAPWPMIPWIGEQMLDSPELQVRKTPGGWLASASVDDQIFILRWNDRDQIEQMFFGSPSEQIGIWRTYSQFQRAGGEWWIPTKIDTRARSERPGGEISDVENPTTLQSIVVNGPARPFDPKKMNLWKVDRDTGDVTDAEGGLVYNEKEMLRKIDDASWQRRARPYALAVVAVAVLIAAVWQIRRRIAA